MRNPILAYIGGNIKNSFLPIFGGFGILGWIRTGDGMHNPVKLLRFRRFSTFLAFRSEVVIFSCFSFFRTLRLVFISAKPYYQNARIDREIIFGFR